MVEKDLSKGFEDVGEGHLWETLVRVHEISEVMCEKIYVKLLVKSNHDKKVGVKDVRSILGGNFHIPKDQQIKVLKMMERMGYLQINSRFFVKINVDNSKIRL